MGMLAGAVLVAAAALRLIDLDVNPPGLWQDEASTAVDAWQIWHTGRDRAGAFLPVASRSFGDYPLALYRYLDAPFVGLGGLTPAHERIVAALTGIAFVLASGAFALQLFGPWAALGTMLSVAFGPMCIVFSRYGSEAILLPFFLTLGAALFEHGRAPDRRRYLYLGAVALAASAYTYHAVKVLLPLWILGFLIYHRPLIRALWPAERRHVLGPALLFAALVLPSFIMAFTKEGNSRGSMMAWARYPLRDLPRIACEHYFSYFDPWALFARGAEYKAQSYPGAGLFSLIDLPLMLLGVAAMARRGTDRRACGFIAWWFVLGPLPGGLSIDSLNVGRAIGWLPMPQVLSGLGFGLIAAWVAGAWVAGGRRARRLVPIVALALGTAWLATGLRIAVLVLRDYRHLTGEWQYDVHATMQCALEQRHHGERIVVSPDFDLADTFAWFHFAALDQEAPPGRRWTVAQREKVEPDELFVFPARGRFPAGRPVCEVKEPFNGTPLGYVYAAAEPPG